MKPDQFIQCAAEWFESWFRLISSKILTRELIIGVDFSFPTLLRVGESPSHYVIDLVGAKDILKPEEYRIKVPDQTEKIRNVTSFICPGPQTQDDALALINVAGEDNAFLNLTLATKFDKEMFERHIDVPLTKSRLQAGFEATVPLKILKTADRVIFGETDLIRSDGLQIFFRRISTAIVVRKSVSEAELVDWLSWKSTSILNAPAGGNIVGLNIGYGVSKETFALDLLGLSQQDVSESIIDTFIQQNKPFFVQALRYKDALSQPKLKIVKRAGLEGEYLKPDYLMLRADGGYDILDLKKALIPSVTVGKKNRLRFSAYVTELIAQLDGYRRYFSSPENASWMKDQGIVAADDPRLIGIVGNHNNFERDKVDIAIGPYRDNLAIISYSEVVNLLKRSEELVSPGL